ncbi:MAG: rhodanese-like domain-containing protein, partial [Chloroflexi bacterium]
QINAAELKQKLDANESIIMVDVRTPGEYEFDGRITGSRLIPLSVLTSRVHEIPKDKTIVCVCRSGNRSYTACEILASQGFTDVINLSGGMFGWRRAGLPHQ